MIPAGKGDIFAIMPVKADPKFENKTAILRDLLGDRVILPEMRTSLNPPAFELSPTVGILKRAFRVIADLSFERPSCYFELGLAQALGCSCVVIAENGTRIHQHSGSVMFYTSIEEFKLLVGNSIADY